MFRRTIRSWRVAVCIMVAAVLLDVRPLIAQERGVLGLTVQEATQPGNKGDTAFCSLLIRETIRQGLLLAGREELQLATRDEALREPLESARAAGTLLDISIEGRLPIRIRVSPAGEPGKVLWEGELAKADWYNGLLTVTEQVEVLSRETLPGVLREAGLAGKPVEFVADGAVPDAIAADLARLDELSQFAAARALHELIRTEGASPQRLGALVRAYAHLGQLTGYYSNATSEVFAARALLYAQRMVVAQPQSRWAMYHRSYAKAVLGMHKAALDDLAAVETLPADPAPVPTWAALIEPLCKYETARLTDLAAENPENAPLAMFLAFLTVENGDAWGARMNFAQAAMEFNPTCFRVLDAMCEMTGPGLLNELSESVPQAFGVALAERLPAVPSVPQSIPEMVQQLTQAGGNPRGRVMVIDAMLETEKTDRVEPSVAALARMIQEVTFIHVQRRVNLVANQWGVDASGTVESMQHLVADHPYRNLIEAYGLVHANNPEKVRELLQSIELRDDNYGLSSALRFMRQWGITERREKAWLGYIVQQHSDPVAGDYEKLLLRSRGSPEYARWALGYFKKCSPHAPLAVATSIQLDWETIEPQAAEIEARHGGHPTVAKALAEQYAKLERWADAERCWARYLEISPDETGFRGLAGAQQRQGRLDQWLATLKRSLEEPDYGLSHSRTRAAISDYYTDMGDHEQAIQWGEQAAQSGAMWALLTAANAHEAAGNWDEAEAYVKEAAEHYSQPELWLKWCVRTGHGDLRGAGRWAKAAVKEIPDTADREAKVDAVSVHLLLGENDIVVRNAKKLYTETGDVWVALHAAAIADAAGDVELRDGAIAAALSKGRTHKVVGRVREELLSVAELYQTTFASGPDAVPDPRQVEEIIAGAKVLPEVVNMQYFVAKLYAARKRDDLAVEYFKRCVLEGDTALSSFTLAHRELRQRGIEPRELLAAKKAAAATRPAGKP